MQLYGQIHVHQSQKTMLKVQVRVTESILLDVRDDIDKDEAATNCETQRDMSRIELCYENYENCVNSQTYQKSLNMSEGPNENYECYKTFENYDNCETSQRSQWDPTRVTIKNALEDVRDAQRELQIFRKLRNLRKFTNSQETPQTCQGVPKRTANCTKNYENYDNCEYLQRSQSDPSRIT